MMPTLSFADKLLSGILPLAFLLGFPGSAIATLIAAEEVYCGGEYCGTMEIDRYDPLYLYNPTQPGNIDFWQGAVAIAGQFVRPAGGYSGFHYLQAVTVDDAPLNYLDGTPVAAPYIDTPPGGYENQPFDYKPYYDEGEFPAFYDRPTAGVFRSTQEGDKTVSVYFETWLVCVIEETFGDLKQAFEDTYQLAPLLGWTWGFDITYQDDGDNFWELTEDFQVSARELHWTGNPSQNWLDALDREYGSNITDSYNIELGDCIDCVVPEPQSLALLGLGLSLLITIRVQRCA
jgi:hypothetical protein